MHKAIKFIFALVCPLFISSFACADTLKGEIRQTGSADPSSALKARLGVDQSQLPSVDCLILSKPVRSEHCMNLPYYVSEDHNSSLEWDQWWQMVSWRILKNFNRKVPEPCEMIFNVVISADGKIKADFVGTSTNDPAVERMSHVIGSLWASPDGLVFPPLAFPPGSSREVVWMEILLSKHLGPTRLPVEPKYLFALSEGAAETEVKSGANHP